ncbi:MAG: sigma-70 family RNA polymerase sigma factor [Alistipes sp.]|jgi:RNA polymerase sigma-70 factor (ECF subfamily)|nr:sigma-70 family RNA polymerase sigma factor [Alistipes sp.]MEE1148988.1 sigma-70 family RNA polymerase sigma factor [Alistipes sp.]
MEIDDYIVATDAHLVKLASAGDQQAFEYLFTRYRDALTRLFEQRMGDRDMASDLLQETFIKVYLHLDQYSSNYTFGQWIYTIARNTLVDHLRRKADDIPIDERFRSPQATSPSPEESVIINQSHNHFYAALDELSEEYRQIIQMRFIEEYSYEEMAEKLGKPINTIKTQIRRARAAVCKIILEKE